MKQNNLKKTTKRGGVGFTDTNLMTYLASDMKEDLACSRRSDSRARAKNKASETAGKKRGETGEEDVFPSLPSFFSCSFARFIFRSRSTI